MVDRDINRTRLIARRALMLGGVQLGMAGILAGRMYYLQVMQSDRYRVLADDNRINMRLLAPTRGLIVDATGAPLAANDQNFQLLMVVEQVPDLDETLKLVSRYVPIGETDIKRIMKEVEHKRSFVPVIVRENLTWEEVAAIELNTPDLPGLSIEVGQVRSYPLGNAASHLVGYVGAVAESDMDGDPVLTLPGFKIGKNGAEKYNEDILRGKPGESQIEVNAYGRMIRELGRHAGTAGQQVQLTIDAGLQEFAFQRLAPETSAAAVIMDIHTGAIYAMASYPGFDPNLFSKGIPADVWEELLSDPGAPLTDKSTAGQYPPGSTFKMVTGLAGLESGAITVDHKVVCTGSVSLGDHEFHCWKKDGHGSIGLTEAYAQSCDVFFYDVGKRAGIDAIASTAHRLGLGAKLDIDLPGERPGLIPTRAWKRAMMGEPWEQGETLVNAIGQGFVKATPLQLAVMTARLANGGITVKPHLVKQVEGQTRSQKTPSSLGFNPEHLQAILTGMEAVTDHGTAARSQIPDPTMRMAGKTGSAQVRRMTAYERANHIKSESLPWKDRDHALFVAYAPIGNPRYACAVIAEHGNHGASTAAPIARDLLWETQKRDPARLHVATTPVSSSG